MLAIPKGRKVKRMDRDESAFALPKENRVRSEAYRRHVALKPCRVCGQVGAQAAHLGHSSMGMKVGDDAVVSLCPGHHRDFDTCPKGKEWWWMHNVTIPEAQAEYRRWEMMK